jgi:hypothetical protein
MCNQPIILPFYEYARPIWEAWDEAGYPCPKADKWMDLYPKENDDE